VAQVAGPSEHELVGRPLPDLLVRSTSGTSVRLAALDDVVLFVYPRTGRPDEPVLDAWTRLPGARGCTAESCGFRDLAADFRTLGLSIFGLSSQDRAEQHESAERLRLGYPLLSDPELELGRALGLGTFRFEGRDLYRRSTLVVRDGAIVVAQLDVSDAFSHPQELLALLRRTRER